jgi:hypothetical protein
MMMDGWRGGEHGMVMIRREEMMMGRDDEEMGWGDWEMVSELVDPPLDRCNGLSMMMLDINLLYGMAWWWWW